MDTVPCKLHLRRPAEAGRPTSTRCSAEGKRPSLRGRVFVLARLHGERALTLLKGGQRPCGVCVGDLRLPTVAFLGPSLTACRYHGPLVEYSSTPSVPPLALATREEDNCDRGGVSGLSVLCRVGVVWGEVVGPPACLRCDVGKCGRGGLIMRVWVGEQTNGCMGVRVDGCRGGCVWVCI